MEVLLLSSHKVPAAARTLGHRHETTRLVRHRLLIILRSDSWRALQF